MGNIIRSLVSGFTNVVDDVFGAPLDFLSGKSCRKISVIQKEEIPNFARQNVPTDVYIELLNKIVWCPFLVLAIKCLLSMDTMILPSCLQTHVIFTSSCGSTWDLLCYIENFCVANLLKLVAVLFLFYIVLLFIYLVFKLGICGCLGRGTCKMLWASLSSGFSACEYGYMFLWAKLQRRKSREERFGDIEDFTSSSSGDELMSERTTYVRVPGTAELRSSSMKSRERRRRMRMERSLRARSHRLRVGLSRGGSAYVASERSPRPRPRRRRHGRQHVKTVHDIRVTRTSKFVRKAGASRLCRRRW